MSEKEMTEEKKTSLWQRCQHVLPWHHIGAPTIDSLIRDNERSEKEISGLAASLKRAFQAQAGMQLFESSLRQLSVVQERVASNKLAIIQIQENRMKVWLTAFIALGSICLTAMNYQYQSSITLTQRGWNDKKIELETYLINEQLKELRRKNGALTDNCGPMKYGDDLR